VAARYTELGDALLPLINPVVTAKYGLEIASFIVENVSVPPEVEQAIDKRSSMAAIGNMNEFVKYQMAKGFEAGKGGGGAAGTASELAVGFAIAQQMMAQAGIQPPPVPMVGGAPAAAAAPTAPPPPGATAAQAAPAAPAIADLLSPAEAAQALGVSEGDVMSIISSGELKAKKIGSAFRIKRSAIDEYLAQ
ncbi:MAG: excisionase family DNA-binding protein, partial [Vicinamibacterales bacterium]|nr:excisionase family DNA-binding protein [Vicinamibacterales bacterium]